MVNRMRATRAHRDNRRSHHALDDVRLSKCSNCSSMHIRHTLCTVCGFYRGKKIVDMTALIAKKAKKVKEKENNMSKSLSR
ncbi:MAG TPA: 50S ribosomal protein L32 [Candidatus Paceibacterota bacterium]